MDKIFEKERKKFKKQQQHQQNLSVKLINKLKFLVNNPIDKAIHISSINNKIFWDGCVGCLYYGRTYKTSPELMDFIKQNNKNNKNIKFAINNNVFNYVRVKVDLNKRVILYILDLGC